jgi:hypothetical protein
MWLPMPKKITTIDGFAMANLLPEQTGLPFVVFIFERMGARHDVRIMVGRSAKIRISKMLAVAIRRTVRVVEGQLEVTGNHHPDHVVVHVQLTVPSPMSADALAFARAHGIMEDEFEPRLNRVGHLGYQTRFGDDRVVRAVHIQSFVFLIHLYPDILRNRAAGPNCVMLRNIFHMRSG